MSNLIVIDNFIGGRSVPATAHFDSFNPSTGHVLCRIPDSGAEEIDAAVKAAQAAFPAWSSKPREERSKLLYKVADLLESRLEEFARAESTDQGKPLWLARTVDIPRAVYNFRFFAGAVLHSTERASHNDQVGAINYTLRQPVGVAGLISPWNLPLYLLTWKIAPALATGNTVVAKPSEITSLTASLLASVLADAGIPAGVCNLVFGLGSKAGAALVQHPDVPLISFTGGTATARHIIEKSAQFYKKLSLELGGKNAAVIFDDCNFDECVATTVRSSFTNQGEICLCSSRILIQKGIFDRFVAAFAAQTRTIVVGAPDAEGTRMGALVSKEHLGKVQSYVQIARDEGATIHCGDGVDALELPEANRGGYFMRPTIISGVSLESRCVKEEIFGPVVVCVPFETEDDAVTIANSVEYGLAACVWTENGSRMHRVARRLQAGTVWGNCWMVRDLNMPFGGMKASGIGREGGEYSIEFFTEEKTVCIKY